MLSGPSVKPLTQVYLFAAARAQHVADLIAPSLANGFNVVCDRFVASSYAYQIAGNQQSEWYDLFWGINSVAIESVQPFYILIDLPVETALERLGHRLDQSNHFDRNNQEYFERVREGFLYFVPTFPHCIIDGDRALEKVQQEVVQVVCDHLQLAVG